MAEIDLFPLLLLLGESHSFGVMLIAQLNVKFLLTKEGKDWGGCSPAPRQRSPARVGWAWPERRGLPARVNTWFRLPPCFSVTVCVCMRVFVCVCEREKVCSFSLFSVLASSSHSTADLLCSPAPPAPSRLHTALPSATVPGIADSQAAVTPSYWRGEGRVCAGKCARARLRVCPGYLF